MLYKFNRTNHHDMKYPKSHLEVQNRLIDAADKLLSMPYAIIQPHLVNKLECKVVCLNGFAKYYTKYSKGKKFADKNRLHAFAEKSIQLLKRNCPSAMVDGLVRVDIMCRFNGEMVVNEFESLEAMYTSSRWCLNLGTVS